MQDVCNTEWFDFLRSFQYDKRDVCLVEQHGQGETTDASTGNNHSGLVVADIVLRLNFERRIGQGRHDTLERGEFERRAWLWRGEGEERGCEGMKNERLDEMR